MFCLKKDILLLAAFALATATPLSTTSETSTETSTEPRALMQMQIMEIDNAASDGLYHYKCYAGVTKTGHVMCSAGDSIEFDTPNDVEVKLRCPGSGAGKSIAYIETLISITSRQLECQIIEGGIGQGFIGLRIVAQNTFSLKYDTIVQSHN